MRYVAQTRLIIVKNISKSIICQDYLALQILSVDSQTKTAS